MRTHLMDLHQNAQRLLKPLAVVNPYAHRLTFGADKTRARRDHEKYLTLIDTIALLHQYQREVKTLKTQYVSGARSEAVAYIEVTVGDIEQANAIAHEVLGRSLDELPPQTRRVLAATADYVHEQMREQAVVQSAVRFTRRALREATGWGDTQLRVHLGRLLELEYLIAHRGARGQRFEYELLFDGDAGGDAPRLMGLIDVERLRREDKRSAQASRASAAQSPTTGQSSRGQASEFAAPSRGERGAVAATSLTGDLPGDADMVRVVNGQGRNRSPLSSAPPNEQGPIVAP